MVVRTRFHLDLLVCTIVVVGSTLGVPLGSCVVEGHESICAAMIRADQVFSGLVIGEESVPTTEVLFDLVEARGARGAIIDGIARDNQGGGIPGVEFALRDTRRNLVRSGVSDDEGRFRWSDLPAGTYALTGTQSGFDPVEM